MAKRKVEVGGSVSKPKITKAMKGQTPRGGKAGRGASGRRGRG